MKNSQIIFTLFFCLNFAFATKDETTLPDYITACDVPGKILHWEINYCLAKLETDDFDGVRKDAEKCMADLKSTNGYPKSSCKQKQFLKKKYCELKKKYNPQLSLDKCYLDNSKDNLPTTVRNDGIR